MKKIFLIIQREYLTRVKKKSFIIMTILGPLLMASLMIGAIWIGSGIEEKQKVLVVDELNMFDNLINSEKVQFYHTNISLAEAKALFHSSEYTSIAFINSKIFEGNTIELFYKKQPGFIAFKTIENALEDRLEYYKLQKLRKALNSEALEDLYNDIKTDLAIKPVSFKEIGKEKEGSKDAGIIGFVFAIMIYLFIFMYGVQVMRGVIEEKTSRIVEVIISSVKPFQLMMGKIIGIAFVGLTQFLLWIILTTGLIVGAKSYFFQEKYDITEISNVQMSSQMFQDMNNRGEEIDTDKIISLIERINFPYMISLFIFYFLGGYLLYASLFAAIGAAVDSESDTQQFMLPVTIPLVFAFIIAQTAMQNPEGPLVVWASIIPLTSPVVMMIRIATVPFSDLAFHLLVSMILLIVGFIFTTWIAGKIYRTGILMYGKKVNYKELWKWMTYRS